jgi:hypothetical protein
MLKMIKIFGICFGLLMIAFQAFAVPVLQVGIKTEDGYVPYTTQGPDEETAFTTINTFSLALAGSFGPNTAYLGGKNDILGIDWDNLQIGLDFLKGATGPVLMVTVPEGTFGSISFSPPLGSNYLAPTFIIARTGSDDSGFPDNHWPVGQPDSWDFWYFDLGTAFSNNSNGVVNCANPSEIGNGEIRFYDTTITDFTYAHFDLLAIEISGGQNGGLTPNLVFNPGSHDASYVIPEPATMILLGSGLIGLAGFARRKFKK